MTRPSWYGRLPLVGVALTALVTHITYGILAAPNILDVSDAGTYHLLGRHLAEGHGYVRPYDFVDHQIRATAEFPPVFPMLLGIFHFVGIRSYGAQRVGLAFVHAGVAVMVVWIARRWWSPRVAVALGLVAAVHPGLFQPGSALLAETLFVATSVGLLLLVLRLREAPSVSTAAAIGLVGGIGTLVRAEGLLLAVLLAVPVIVAARSPAGRPRLGAAFLIALLLLPGAWAVRNARNFTEPVLLSNNLGSVLSGANCDETYHGPLTGFWRVSDECYVGVGDFTLGDESVVAASLRRDGLSYVAHHWDELPRVAAFRVLRTFQMWQPEQQARLSTYEGRRLLTERLTGWFTWGACALAVLGAVAVTRRRAWWQLWFLAAPILVVVAVAAATYGNPRFRIAAEVPLLLLAAEGLRLLAGLVRRRDAAPGAASTRAPTG